LVSLSNKSKAKKLDRDLKEVQAKYGLQVTEQEHWNKRIIGIDKTNLKVIYLDQHQGGNGIVYVDLNQISAVKTFKYSDEKVNSEANQVDSASKLGLQFIPKNSDGLVQEMAFFDMSFEAPHQLHSSYDLAKKWQKLIDASLKKISTKSKQAS